MYYVYFILSLKNDDLYIGYTEDPRERFKQHNDGKVKSTKSLRPWVLVGYEAYRDKEDATKREYFLKTGQQREMLKIRLKNSLGKIKLANNGGRVAERPKARVC